MEAASYNPYTLNRNTSQAIHFVCVLLLFLCNAASLSHTLAVAEAHICREPFVVRCRVVVVSYARCHDCELAQQHPVQFACSTAPLNEYVLTSDIYSILQWLHQVTPDQLLMRGMICRKRICCRFSWAETVPCHVVSA